MFNLLNLLKKNAWGIGFLFVTVLLVVTVVACGPAGRAGKAGPAGSAGPAGPAGKAGPDGVAGRSAGEGGPSMSATIAGGKLIIAGSGFPAGKGIWLNIPGAAAEGRDVFLTTDLAIVNASGAFGPVTLDMSKPPIGGKGGLKPGVYSIKSVGGDVVATAPLIIPAPPATPAPAKAATPAATPAAKAATPAATPAPTKAATPAATAAPTKAATPAVAVAKALPASHAGRTTCTVCHEAGIAGAPKLPATHAGRTDATCNACHK
ncbi:MAG: hypothetical protein AAB037_02500 [Chloroflexota bacterium]